ncbi:MAG: cytochrome c oxidase subunit 3 [Candidatus Acidiferrales bacterium]
MASTTYPSPGPAAKPSVVLPGTRAWGGARAVATPQMAATQTGIWVCVCAIFMCFAAFISALVVREGASSDWRHLTLPHILYLNTLILLASSYTLEVSRRRFALEIREKKQAGHATYSGPRLSLYVTIALGTAFVIGQWIAWTNLAAHGLFLSTNPSSSFFYVLTAMHGLHVLGGMAGLIYMARRLARSVTLTQANALGAAAIYWHFMGLLWVFLFMVMAIRL